MPNLLRIDSSPLYGRSVSRELIAEFVSQWKSSHPDGRVADRDLNATAIPPITAEWVSAVYTPDEARTPRQKEQLSLSDSLLKLWIDQIARVGRTFSYADGTPMGLLVGKKDATFLTAGGTKVLSQGHDRDGFLAPYLQAVRTHARSIQGVAA